MKKFLIAAILALCIFGGYVYRLKQDDTPVAGKILPGGDIVHVGTMGTYAPWTYQNAQGDLVGFEIDMWKEIARRIGCSVQFTQMKFAGLFGAMDKGDLDTVANQVSKNSEREAKYNFSDVYVYNEIVFLSKAGRSISSPSDLNGWSVTIEPNSNDEDIVKAYESEHGIQLQRYYYEGNSIEEVVLGRVDLWCRSLSASMETIKQRGKDRLQIIARTPLVEENAYPFKKDRRGTVLRDLTNKALKEMQSDGTIAALALKHFGLDLSRRPENTGE